MLVSVAGTLLPAGSLACVWIYALHHHPALWRSPEAFLPRRWLDGGKQVTVFVQHGSGNVKTFFAVGFMKSLNF